MTRWWVSNDRRQRRYDLKEAHQSFLLENLKIAHNYVDERLVLSKSPGCAFCAITMDKCVRFFSVFHLRRRDLIYLGHLVQSIYTLSNYTRRFIPVTSSWDYRSIEIFRSFVSVRYVPFRVYIIARSLRWEERAFRTRSHFFPPFVSSLFFFSPEKAAVKRQRRAKHDFLRRVSVTSSDAGLSRYLGQACVRGRRGEEEE